MQKMFIIAGLLVSVFFLTVIGNAATLHVEPNGVNDAGRDGLSWATAFATINYAVGRAAGGDNVLMTNGIYNVTAATGIGKDLTITGVNGSDHTILNGMAGGYHAFSSSGANTVTIRGLTMTNFIGVGNGVISVSSAGCEWFLYDCVIRANSGNAGAFCTAGESGAIAHLQDCVIEKNTFSRGGGLFVYNDTFLYLTRTHVISNTATTSGGGLDFYPRTTGNIVMEFDECSFVGNTAATYGGLYIPGAGTRSIIFRDCVISENSCTGQGSGGITALGQDVRISDSKITYNESGATVDGHAGGVRLTGGIIENSLVAHNSIPGRYGGGLNLGAGTIVRNCTVVSNTAARSGGIRGTVADAFVVNSIVYHNMVTDLSLPVTSNYWSRDSGDNIFFTNSLTAPDPAVYGKGMDSQTDDPMFGSDPYRFKPLKGSPAINAGTNDIWMIGKKDLAGHSRIAEGIVDIGAYEHHPPGTIISLQ